MCAVSRLHLGLCLLIVSKMERTHKLRLWCDVLKASVLQEAARFEERTLLAAEAFRATEASPFRVLKTESANSYGWGGGEPFRVLRVAHANAHILRNMPIRIREGELLVGWHPNTQLDPEMGQAVQAAREYLTTQNYWRNIPEGHIAPDYATILARGLGGIKGQLEELESSLHMADPQTPEKRAFYLAARTSLQVQRVLRSQAERPDIGSFGQECRWQRCHQ